MMKKLISFKEAQLACYSEGSGFPLIFIHGFCQDHSIWTEFIKPFIHSNRIIIADNPGFGESSLPNHPLSMDDYADCIKAVLDSENISSCLMIGHSLGGYITLNFASRFPEYLKGFCLFNSTAYPDDENRKPERDRAAEFVKRNGSPPFVNELYKKLFGGEYYQKHQQEISELKKYFGSISSVEGVAQASLAMRDRKDTTDVLKQSQVPVLFIIGKEDKAVEYNRTMKLTYLPEAANICILPSSGHMGMVEAGEQAQEEIIKWMELCLR